jgi:hypothetical protein
MFLSMHVTRTAEAGRLTLDSFGYVIDPGLSFDRYSHHRGC